MWQKKVKIPVTLITLVMCESLNLRSVYGLNPFYLAKYYPLATSPKLCAVAHTIFPRLFLILDWFWLPDALYQADQSGTIVEILADDGKSVSVDTVCISLKSIFSSTFYNFQSLWLSKTSHSFCSPCLALSHEEPSKIFFCEYLNARMVRWVWVFVISVTSLNLDWCALTPQWIW